MHVYVKYSATWSGRLRREVVSRERAVKAIADGSEDGLRLGLVDRLLDLSGPGDEFSADGGRACVVVAQSELPWPARSGRPTN